MFRTLRQRLPQKLRLAGVVGMAAANRFLHDVFAPAHNARFAVAVEESAFVPYAGVLEDVLCVQEEHVAGNDHTVRYKRLTLAIPPGRHRNHYVKSQVRVCECPDGTLAVFAGPRPLVRDDREGRPVDTERKEAAQPASTRQPVSGFRAAGSKAGHGPN